MFRLMEKARNKDNKGFSLVELIVVVLIIAIIAVALAPQVVKYVQTARTNVELNNEATVKSAAQAAVAEYQGNNSDGKVKTCTYNVTYSNNVTSVAAASTEENAASGSAEALASIISDNIGTSKLDYNYSVTVNSDGTVTVSQGTANK